MGSEMCIRDRDIDSDTLGYVCDDDMDNDGVPNIVELRFGGNQTDANDAAY